MKYVNLNIIGSRGRITLSDVPEVLCWLFEPAIKKGGIGVTLINDKGKAVGNVLSVKPHRGKFRIYLKTDKGSGEYRFDAEKAKRFSLDIY